MEANDTEQAKAIPFILDKNGKFEVTDEAKKFFYSLDGKHVGVISAAGKYRTGKSYFINRVILQRGGKGPGFNVGPTINPCTKGLWVWNKTMKSKQPDGSELDVVVVDCEGFGGMDENSDHDSKIFIFALLLSSFFIYNSKGTIDERALESLSLVV